MTYSSTDLAADLAASAARHAGFKHYSERTPAEEQCLDAERLNYILSRVDNIIETNSVIELLACREDAETILRELVLGTFSPIMREYNHMRLRTMVRDAAAELAGREYDQGKI